MTPSFNLITVQSDSNNTDCTEKTCFELFKKNAAWHNQIMACRYNSTDMIAVDTKTAHNKTNQFMHQQGLPEIWVRGTRLRWIWHDGNV